MVNQVVTGENILNKFKAYSCFLLWMLRLALCVEDLFGLDAPLAFECLYVWEDLLYFWPLFSWDYFPVILFDVSVELLDYSILKLSCGGCLHELIVVEFVLVVACSKRYGIHHILLYP